MLQRELAEFHAYDCIGVGFGPSNIALAIALEERSMLDNCLFLEAQADFHWHSGMLLDGSDIQHNPLRDLVTPRNPKSEYGFLSYLKANDRLFDYLNLAAPYPPRSEYAGYIKWVADQFRHVVRLNTRVESLSFCNDDKFIHVTTKDPSGTTAQYYARTLAFATGRSEQIPDAFRDVMGSDVVHLKDYLPAKKRWLKKHRRPCVAVIGASQSAVEIILDLSNCADVISVSRSFSFKQKDLSAFTENIYYPSFVDYFFNSGMSAQNSMMQELWRSNYGAADPDVIEVLNFKLYEQKVRNAETLCLHKNTVVTEARRNEETGPLLLTLEERYDGVRKEIEVDGIVLATGYKNFGFGASQEPFHPLLTDLVEVGAAFRSDGGIDIDRDYRLKYGAGCTRAAIFINGLCEASHGFGDAGSFSLLSIRSYQIASALEAYLDHTQPLDIKDRLYDEARSE